MHYQTGTVTFQKFKSLSIIQNLLKFIINYKNNNIIKKIKILSLFLP